MQRVLPLAALLVAVSCTSGHTTVLPDPEPGTRIEVRAESLPSPYAQDSVANAPRTVSRAGQAPRVPEGFRAVLFAEGLDHARWLAVAENGDVFVSQARAGTLTVLRDSSGDGVADQRSTFLSGLNRPHGMVFHAGHLYIADTEAVWRVPYHPGDLTAQASPQRVTPRGALGEGSGHWTRNLIISPDGRTLLVAIGSRGNIGREAEPRATIRAFDLSADGATASAPRTFAAGLRNPVGLAYQPGTDHLWTVVNERDGLGDELPPDYLTRVEEGAFYGWPYAYIGPNPQPELAARAPDLVAATRLPEVLFRAHSAPLGLVFYDHEAFPEDYRGDAFVGLRGSWNAIEPRGYAVARVLFENGAPTGAYELFATGFRAGGQDRAEVWGRPVGVAVSPDGAVLVADDTGNTVWRLEAVRP